MFNSALRSQGVRAALLSAVLFGISVPLVKLILTDTGPWMTAALIYLGAGLGLLILSGFRRNFSLGIPRDNLRSLLGAVAFGGVLAPVFLMQGLSQTSAANTSILLNAETAFTILLAWMFFKENMDLKLFIGVAMILGGAVTLRFSEPLSQSSLLAMSYILLACLFWAIDNNISKKISNGNTVLITAVKGIIAGTTNLTIALTLSDKSPNLTGTFQLLAIGFICYGISLTLFIFALSKLGTARTGAYFSSAPFFGAFAGIILGDPLSPTFVFASVLILMGIILHLVEKHEHEHEHDGVVHTHPHYPDLQHLH